TERINVEHPLFLIFGQPSLGKTSLGFSCEKPILLNFDTESALARAVNRGPAINVLTIDALRELEEGTDLIAPYATVVIDPVGSCVNLMAAAITDENGKYGREGNLTLQGYGVLKSRFRSWMTKIRAMGKNILLTAHHKEDKDHHDIVFVRPDITGASRDEVMRLADFVGFLEIRGKDCILDFSPTQEHFGKNPAQWPAWTIPAPEQARTFMAQLFQMGREALSKASEASASVAQQVEDWKLAIRDFSLAEEFNRAIPEILKLEPAAQAQVKKLLMERARAAGVEFDKTKKQFAPLLA